MAIYAVLAAAWIWLCLGTFKVGRRRSFGLVAIQLSVLTAMYELIRSSPIDAILTALFPPIVVFEIPRFLRFSEFLGMLTLPAALCFFAVLTACLAIKPLRIWGVSLPILSTALVLLIVGEAESRRSMCEKAAPFGVSHFPRNSLFWSLRNAPREFQFDIHARLEVDGIRYGWSYREVNWYEIPETAWGEVDGPTHMCLP